MNTRSYSQKIRRIAGGIIRHLPLVVLALSLSVNLLIAKKLLRAQESVTPRLAAGTEARSFAASSPTGDQVRISFPADVPTILYHFSPSCSWCERNWENISALATQTKGRYRVVGVSTTAVSAEFVRDHAIPFEVASMVSVDVAQQYHLGGTPQTILVSADGRVMQDWAGAYVGVQAQELAAYFGLQLPGLRRSAVPATN
jgi:peroxiredoxin